MLFSERIAEAVALRLRRAQLEQQKQQLAGQMAQLDSAMNQVTTELSAHDAAIEAMVAAPKPALVKKGRR